MRFCLVEEEIYSASMNMAIDHAIYESVANDRELPTIRFYKWLNPSVSVGAYQDLRDINLDFCKLKKIDVVRRMTGGAAIFHDKNDFTYSVIAHIRTFNYSIKNAYDEICAALISSLADICIQASLKNKNDIIVKGKKISGNAAKAMDKGIYLQHGTLVYDLNFQEISSVFNIPVSKIKAKVTSISQLSKIDRQKVYESLKASLTYSKEISVEKLSAYEVKRSNSLAESIYGSTALPSGSFSKRKGACYIRGAV